MKEFTLRRTQILSYYHGTFAFALDLARSHPDPHFRLGPAASICSASREGVKLVVADLMTRAATRRAHRCQFRQGRRCRCWSAITHWRCCPVCLCRLGGVQWLETTAAARWTNELPASSLSLSFSLFALSSIFPNMHTFTMGYNESSTPSATPHDLAIHHIPFAIFRCHVKKKEAGRSLLDWSKVLHIA